MPARTLTGLLALVAAPAIAAPIAFTPDGKALLVLGPGGTLNIYSPPEAEQPTAIRAHRGDAVALAVAPDGRRVVTAGSDGVARVWDPKTWKEVATLRGHDGSINALALSPDGSVAATGGADRTARVWDLATGKERVKIGHEGEVRGVGFAPDGRSVFTGLTVPDDSVRGISGPHRGDRVRRWDAATGKPLDFPDVRGYEFATAARLLAVADEGLSATPAGAGRVSVGGRFKVALLTPRGTERAAITKVGTAVTFSADGLYLCVAEYGGTTGGGRLIGPDSQTRGLAVVDVFDGSDVFSMREGIQTAAFSPDGRRLAVPGEFGRPVRFIDLVPTARNEFAGPTTAWTALADGDGKAAHAAFWALVEHGPKAVALIGERVKPAPAVSADQVGKHISALNSSKFAERETATKALQEAGPAAGPALREALKDPPSEEARGRLDRLLALAEGERPPDADDRRRLRAVAVLERINSPEARELLVKLAGGAPGAWLTTDAAAALERARLRAGR
jgi:hypothetical protein